MKVFDAIMVTSVLVGFFGSALVVFYCVISLLFKLLFGV
jgi:hypothetical protein